MPSTICSTSQRCRLLKSFFYCMTLFIWGFPHSSVGKEYSCNAGDLGSIPGSRRSAGEGVGYPLQFSWTSLVAQLVKNPPAMREIWVLFPGKIPWRRERLPTPVFWPGELHGLQPMGLRRVRHDCATFTSPKSPTSYCHTGN